MKVHGQKSAEFVQIKCRSWTSLSFVRRLEVRLFQTMHTNFTLTLYSVGKKFIVESVEKSDLEKGILTSSWFPVIVHSSVSEDLRDAFSQSYFSAFILALERGGWDASNEWNELLPKFCFTYAEEFLSNVWKHGP